MKFTFQGPTSIPISTFQTKIMKVECLQLFREYDFFTQYYQLDDFIKKKNNTGNEFMIYHDN